MGSVNSLAPGDVVVIYEHVLQIQFVTVFL